MTEAGGNKALLRTCHGAALPYSAVWCAEGVYIALYGAKTGARAVRWLHGETAARRAIRRLHGGFCAYCEQCAARRARCEQKRPKAARLLLLLLSKLFAKLYHLAQAAGGAVCRQRAAVACNCALNALFSECAAEAGAKAADGAPSSASGSLPTERHARRPAATKRCRDGRRASRGCAGCDARGAPDDTEARSAGDASFFLYFIYL